MNGLIAFTKKEFTENTRNYRLFIMLSIFALFGFLSPLTAKFMPELVSSLAPGLELNLTEPVALDSWVQFYKNVASLGISLMIILFSSILSTEYAKGTLVIMLTKGLSRPAVILSKFIVMLCIMTASMGLCFGITYGYTSYFWQGVTLENVFISALFLWINGILYLAVVTLGSVITKGAFASVILVLIISITFSLLGMIPVFSKFNPMLLSTKNVEIINGSIAVSEMVIPLFVSLAISVVSIYAAVLIFNKKQL